MHPIKSLFTSGSVRALVLSGAGLIGVPNLFSAVAEPVIVARGANHRVWEQENFLTLSNGKVITNRSSYVELTSGLHRPAPEGGYLETSPRIEVSPDGQHGLVRNLQYQVSFAGNLATANALDVSLPDGQRLVGNLVGLAYFDGPRSVMITEPKDVVGEIAGAEENELIFRDAFSDVAVDVQYVVERGRLAQNLILRQQLPSPLVYGLTENAVLTVLTEFTTFPAVERQARPVAAEAGAFKDEQISLGTMEFAAGHALAVGEGLQSSRARIRHSWEVFAGGRNCLVEQIAWKQLEPELRTLPPANADAGKRWQERRVRQQAMRGVPPAWLPEKRVARAASGSIKTAQAGGAGRSTAQLSFNAQPSRLYSTPGYLLDFELVTGSTMVFRNDRTYYVSGPVYLGGTFEGGCVIKYAPTNNAGLHLLTAPVFKTDIFRPVILTARDDHTVGEKIGTAVLSGFYANPAFSGGQLEQYQHLRISYAKVGIACDDDNFSVRHSQFVHCDTAIKRVNAANFASLENVLLHNVRVGFDGASAAYDMHITGTHLTVNVCSNLTANGASNYCSLKLTNSLLVAVTNNGPFLLQTSFVARASSPADVFQTVGSGSHYLISGSIHRNAGTTNIGSTLLADLKKRTTYPPVVIGDGSWFTNSLTLYPQAQRDTDAPDLGYHYDCLDYVFSALPLTNATITAMPGVAIGTRTLNSYGLALLGGASFFCEGTPGNLNRIVRYNTVQEQANTNWTEYTSYGSSIITAWTPATTAPHARIRFTEFSVPAGTELYHFWGMLEDAGSHDLRDCQFHGGILYIQRATMGVTNGLFNRTRIVLEENYDMNPIFRQCTFAGGELQLIHAGSGTWTFQNNLFDATTNSYVEGSFTNNYNAYTTNATRLTPNGANDVKLSVTNIAYQTGWLGRFYLPTNLTSHSTLFNAGSTNAHLLGFYHYTAVTNQTRELTGVIDFGFHSVAVNSSGQPLDTDGDGLADYFEDTDGDGTADAGETNWQSYNSLNGLSGTPGLQVFTPLK